jgi:hypothetical protein
VDLVESKQRVADHGEVFTPAWMVESMLDLVVQERFGHSTISITLGMYSHVGPTLHDEAAAHVASLVLGPYH